MVNLTHLDGSAFVLNADRIETLEARPDTVITLIDGKHLVVRESVDEVVARIIGFRRAIRGVARTGEKGLIDG